MHHLVLLGDSIFDNGAYTEGGLSVIDQVRAQSSSGWNASLLAVDGATANDALRQLKRLPPDVTHMALSVGGNDALACIPQLSKATTTVMEGLHSLSLMQSEFLSRYQALIAALLALHHPLVLCTVYDQVPGLSDALKTALSLFNDVILSQAIRCKLPVLDLRLICTGAQDFSSTSPIEPSSVGGGKLASRLMSSLAQHEFKNDGCKVYF